MSENKKRVVPEDYELSGNEFAICPWCGYEDHDSFELSDGETDCNECGKPFEVSIEVIYKYSTAKPADYPDDEEQEASEG